MPDAGKQPGAQAMTYSNGNRRQPRRQAKGMRKRQPKLSSLMRLFHVQNKHRGRGSCCDGGAHKNRARLWTEYDCGFPGRCFRVFFAVPDFRISLPMAHYPLGSGAGYMAESDPTRTHSTHSGQTGSPGMGPQGTGPYFASFRVADPSTTPTRYHRGFPGYATNYSGASGQSPWTGGHPTNFTGAAGEQSAVWPGYPSSAQQPGSATNNEYTSQSYPVSAAPTSASAARPSAPHRRFKRQDPDTQFHDQGHYTPSDKGRPKPLKIACNFCRSRKMRCDGAGDVTVPCAKCKAAGQECVYETATRRGWHSKTKSVYVQAEIEARRNAAAAAGRR
ncbi:Zn(2)-C6 fungal-type domain-containing protein [Mycena chlorophos]|uniref:Zn(2)-C6 fungal-type domain-containing protein n=1 Tax=Mycena chlorophos TaxID=658473 RepID=A0A8H6TQB6_MYCCL|nr:Zn(2)-C6 fungal-type domain-containing protein [Mycena chlorophos]